MYPSTQESYGKYPTNAPPMEFQPQPATGIPVASYNENPQYPLHVQDGEKGHWSSGLCECGTDVSSCCLTCWCPCVTFGRIAEIVDKGNTTCGTAGALYGLLMWFTCCGCLYSCSYRTKLRKQYMLPESPCDDCLVHCCCEVCALCQEHRELQSRGFDLSIGWHANADEQNRGVTMGPTAPVFEGAMTR